ncbi:hypothetical protein H6770_05645 [Candidatus Peribacteria bacterium]|nr:hypothetical protein [Candidatus Peribacteria bacterium]
MANEALQSFVRHLQESDAYRGDSRVRSIINESIQRISALPEDGSGAELRREIRHMHTTLAPLLHGASTNNETAGEISMEEAQSILGDNHFFGTEALQKAFPGTASERITIPPIPFSKAELERAKELGHSLRLRMDHAPDGDPLTMKKMHEMLQPTFSAESKGKILNNISWYGNEEFFTTAAPSVCWVLTSDEVVPNSESKNYLEQTELIAEYLQNTVYADMDLPQEYADAIEELDAQKDEIRGLMNAGNWRQAADKLAALSINQLTRRTPSETLHDLLVSFQDADTRNLQNRWDWSNVQSSDGGLVRVGLFDSEGVGVCYGHPGVSDDYLGVLLSRKFLRSSTS